MELSTYFRINAAGTGQFERTLIVADDDSYVSYLEGCTAPMRDENQLHAAIVEIVVLDRAEVKYSTVQNWYPGDENGRGGVYNFVTKRGLLKGVDSKLSWTQVVKESREKRQRSEVTGAEESLPGPKKSSHEVRKRSAAAAARSVINFFMAHYIFAQNIALCHGFELKKQK